jgi:hypothetical protein
MNKTQACAVLKALELMEELLDGRLTQQPLLSGLDHPHLMMHQALRIVRAELEREDSELQLPPGWRLVPQEPTEEMLLTGHHRIDFDRSDQCTFDPFDEAQRGATHTGTTCAEDLREAYQSMLDKAPQPLDFAGNGETKLLIETSINHDNRLVTVRAEPVEACPEQGRRALRQAQGERRCVMNYENINKFLASTVMASSGMVCRVN